MASLKEVNEAKAQTSATPTSMHKKTAAKAQQQVKGKGNLMKNPDEGQLKKDATIAAMRWVWRSFLSRESACVCACVIRPKKTDPRTQVSNILRMGSKQTAMKKTTFMRSSLALTRIGRKKSFLIAVASHRR